MKPQGTIQERSALELADVFAAVEHQLTIGDEGEAEVGDEDEGGRVERPRLRV